MDLAALARRPLAEQCARLDRLIDPTPPPGLLAALARWPDPAPLAHAIERALAGGCVPPDLAPALAAAPDAHLGRVLRALPGDHPSSLRAPLIDRVVEALDALPFERVAAACFLLRWIGRADPERGAALARDAFEAARAAVAVEPEAIPDATLLRVPGRACAELTRAASRAGHAARWQARSRAFAAATLDGLQSQPKSLSQMGAEDLLSQRVYTDPGHFLMELIQNAEDADARTWRLAVEPERLVVRHDGVPFDARDVVGVLSIGQTTKSAARIGFFGVGFKSVYAITDRPRVRSGPFDFEIADVSIPRRIDDPEVEQGTRLDLPLRAPDDPRLGWRAIATRAEGLPAALLLTLRHIRRMEVEVGGRRRIVERVETGAPGEVLLRDGADGARWLVLGESDPVDGTLVAVPLDDQGQPTPMPAGAPTVFCFLPTRDRPGLRIMVHARFPLPVDRERVDVGAPKTRAALRRAGALLFEAAERAHPWAVLRLLPLPGEVQPPIWEDVRIGFAEAAGARPWIPTPGAGRVDLVRARRAEAALAAALGDIALPDGGRPIHAPDARADAMLAALGAPRLTAADLIELIDHAAGAGRAEHLTSALPEILAALAAAPELSRSADAWADAPIALDAHGAWRPPRALARCPARLRPFFAHRPLLAPALDDAPRLAPLWIALGLVRLDDAAVADALRDRETGPAICARVPAGVLEWMADQPPDRLVGLSHLAVVPDERGALRPIAGGADLPPVGPLAAWAERWPRARPPLVARSIAERFGPTLLALGARRLDIGRLLDGVAGAGPVPAGSALDALHGVLDRLAADLSPRLAERLARAPIFTDVHGTDRPLSGPRRAIVAESDELRSLLPDGPWLVDGLRRARHVAVIDPPTVGPLDAVRGLFEPSAALYAEPGSARWRRLVAWAIAHGPPLDDALKSRLRAAPIWAGGDQRAPLDALRARPENSAWATLYDTWDRWPPPTDEARALSAALGLAERGDAGRRLIADLKWMHTEDPHGAWLDGPALPEALAELGRRSEPDALRPLAELAIHPDAAGARRPLGDALRSDPPWRAILADGARPLLDAGWQARIEPLLERLSVPRHGLEAAVAFAETDPAFPEARDALRAALADAGGPWGAGLTGRISALPLWPSDGRFVPATAVVPPGRLGALAGLPVGALAAQVDPSAAEQADRLADALDFASVGALLAERVAAEAVAGEPLDAQAPWLSSVEAVAAVRRALVAEGQAMDALPLRVDLDGRLVVGPLFDASRDVRHLAARLPIRARITHADDPGGAPLPTRWLLSDLADAQREAGPIDDHPVLAEQSARRALYRWIEAVADEIEADEQARGQLGRAPVWPTTGGTLRAARELMPVDDPLADDAAVDPALDWVPADEIPAEVRRRLRGWFRLDARRLRTAVEHLVDAHRQIDDPARSARLLTLLARLLTAAESEEAPLDALVARFKLHRRLKVADADGRFDRPKALLAPTQAAQAERIALFHPDPPRRPHPAYPEAVRRLLRAAGADVDLSDDALSAALDAPVPGLDAGLARVAYLGARAADAPALIERLDLGARPWLFDRDGTPCAPADLDWPDPDLDALIGSEGGRRPHPAVVHGLPPAVLARLPVRTAADADPHAVARHQPEGTPLPMAVLRWFDDGLDARRIRPDDARAALAGRRIFGADDGRCRPPEALVRDLPAPGLGRRRSGFSDGRPVPRLIGALGIPATPDVSVWLGLAEEIAADARRADLLADEPELREVLPRIVGRLALAGASRPAAVLATTPRGERIVPIDDRALTMPWPPTLAAAAGPADLALIALDAPPESLSSAATRWGVPTVETRWRPSSTPAPAGRPLPDLTRTLTDLWARLPRVLDGAPGDPPTAREVADADAPGRIGRANVPWPRTARCVDGVLCVAEGAGADAIADALWRDRLRPDDAPTEAVARLARLVACGHGAAMDLLLDAEGLPRTGPPPRPTRTTSPMEEPAAPPRSTAPPPAVEPAPAEPETPPPEPPAVEPAPDEDRLLDRLKRWWRGDEPTHPPRPPDPPTPRRPEPPRPDPPRRPPPRAPQRDDDPGFQPPDTSRFFQPQRAVEPQLRADPNWLATRQTATEIGFAFAPGRLAGVHQYGPALITDRFDPRSRRWVAAAIDPEWSAPPAGGGFRVAFTGRLPTGEAALAVPLFGRVSALDAPDARRLTRDEARPLLVMPRPTDVRYTVDLARPPRYVDADPPRVAGLLAPTAPDDELPAECHDLLGGLLDAPPRARLSGIGQFVRRHYRYDPSYLEDPAHARWLRRVTRGRPNVHLAALHAGRDGRHLGAGVCYELNALVCELARRAGIPAAIATGWTFDRGWIDQPDHLWAMALLATEDGPRWMPVDASTTHEGRPLHATPRPPGPHRAQAPRQDRRPPRPVDWTDVAPPPERPGAPLRELLRVIRHAERLGEAPERSEAERLAAARSLLTEPDRARALLAVLDGGGAGERDPETR